VFPCQPALIDAVIRSIFSTQGIFRLIDHGHFHSPVHIVDILSKRAKAFLPTAELMVLKKVIFTGMAKLEDVIKKAKLILDKHNVQLQLRSKNSNDMSYSDSESKYSHSITQVKPEAKLSEVTEQHDKVFLLSLFSFHIDGILTPDAILQDQIQILVGQSKFKPAEFLLKFGEDNATKAVSIKKCIMGLTDKFKDEIETQTSTIYEKTIIKKLPTYLKKIVQTYPSKMEEIVSQLISNFPHKERPSIVTLLVYQRFSLKLA